MSDSLTKLPIRSAELRYAPYVDTSGDGRVTPIDALLVVNDLNDRISKSSANTTAPGEIRVHSNVTGEQRFPSM